MKNFKPILLFFVAILLSHLRMEAATATLFVGQSYQTEINASGYHYLTVESVSSTNPSVAVSKIGLVINATVNSYFSGEATVTAKLRYQLYSGQNYQYRDQVFTIGCNDTQINISPTSTSVAVGETIQLGYGFNRTTYVTPSIQWTSSNESIATVSSDGVVHGIAEGNAVIYARSNLGSNSAQCSIKVSSASGNENPGGNQGSETADESWYNSNDSEFTISTISQFLGFRNLVNNGYDFFSKTVILNNDIDLSSINWTIPIGKSSATKFKGTFDGKNHSITINLDRIDSNSQSEAYYGLFGYSDGFIKNLVLDGKLKLEIADFTTYCYLGGICAYSTGTIDSCRNKSTIEYKRSYLKSTGNEDFIGGIVGNSSNVISNCINQGRVEASSKLSNANTNGYFIGGIAGKGTNRIQNCTNKATIVNYQMSSNGMNLYEYIGGIVGLASGITIQRCSNFGDIVGNARNSGVGGIIGNTNGNSDCNNCYVGFCHIINNAGGTASYVNAICGRIVFSNAKFESNYSANDIIYTNQRNGESGNRNYSSDQMMTEEFAGILGYGAWLGANGLYPIVKGSLDAENYYISTISNITCDRALVSSNVWDILSTNIQSWGVLITQDDGKESFIQGKVGEYTIELIDLTPDRNYKVRWYAQDKEGKEFYGVYATFKTKPITPTTLQLNKYSVSYAILKGESYYNDANKYGFYLQKDDDDEPGVFYWGADINNENQFNLYVGDLTGNTTYKYSAVIEVNGIIYTGNSLTFSTKSTATLPPSDFTDNTAMLNGEVGIESVSTYFEFRAISWPSVIDSDVIPIANTSCGKVSTLSPKLNFDESYKYRIAVETEDNKYYGDWIEFLFQGESDLETIENENNDEAIVTVFNLSGQIVFHGLKKDLNLTSGIYLVNIDGKATKVRVR